MDQPVSTINLSAKASREVDNDVLTLHFNVIEQGKEVNVVQETLRTKLAEALAIIRPLIKDGEVEVETRGFSVGPLYYKNTSNVVGYKGTTSLVVRGTDTATISTLASSVTSMSVAGTSNSLSRKARTALDKELVAEAIATYREKAADAATGFGYDTWAIQEISVSVGGNDYGGSRSMGFSAAAVSAESTPLEIEGGKTTVNASVSGTITVS